MRNSLAALLILAGAVLTFPAVIAGWEQRVLLNHDRFVDLGAGMLEEEPVQQAIAEAAADEVRAIAAANGAPDLLSREQAYALALDLVETLPSSQLGQAVLDGTHRLIRFTFEGPSDAAQARRDQIVLDLKPVVQQVLTLVDTLYPQVADNLVLPDGTGEITVLRESKAGAVVRTARWFNDAALYFVLLPAAVFGLALLVAADRPRTLVFIGLAVLLTSVLRIAVLEAPVESLFIGLAADEGEAAAAVYNDLVDSFVVQDVVIAAAGVALIAAGVAWGMAGRFWTIDDEEY